MVRQMRYDRILAQVEGDQYLSVGEAVKILGASPATIRRDFDHLAEQNLVQRTRGGIKRCGSARDGIMVPFAQREIRFSREKDAIARKAVELLSPEDVVIVGAGTTTYHMAGCLPTFPLKVITNSLRLASVLGDRGLGESQIDVYMVGGYLYPQASILLGPQSRAGFSQYHARWTIMSVGGIDEAGLYNTNELVVDTERAIIERSEELVILADHSKLGHRAMSFLADLDVMRILITDRAPDTNGLLEAISDRGVRVIVADV